MWNCVKGCVREALPRLGTIAVIGIVAGLLALFAGLIVSTGPAGAVLAVTGASVAKVIGVSIAGATFGTLLGCLLGCLAV